MSAQVQQPEAAVAGAVAQRLLELIGRGEEIRPAHETQVRNALDLLRAVPSDPALVRRFEAMSCALALLDLYRRQGRVNAYASALRRLQRDARTA